MNPTASPTPHPWRFFRAGGLDQVRFDTAADLAHLDQLDQKLWVALSCPVKGLEFDEKTLALIDTDKDGRVRAPEVIAALRWAAGQLKDLSALKAGSPTLPLAAINDATDSGKAILASARQILANLGKATATAISLEDTADTAKIFAQTRFNGDGIVPADSATDADTKQAVLDLLATLGAETDRSGAPGVSQPKVEAFFAELAALDAWAAQAERDAANVLPLGDQTAAALAAYQAAKPKVDDYFGRCRLAAFDARALNAVNRLEADYLALATKDLSLTAQEIAGFPLARIEAGRPLPLRDGVNPAWAAAVAALHASVVTPLLGKDRTQLTESEWLALGAKLAPHAAWAATKPATAVEKLGLPRVRALLASPAKAALTALIAQDLALESEARLVADVEKLVRYHRDLFRLLNNFVAFSDFYSADRWATFQIGTLYLDGRACELCVRVDDAGKHAALAGLAKTFLAYCDCTRPGGEKLTIAAAFTGGDSDNLMIGRNGLFYDRKGRDWDATITKIIENPISIRQAFWAPYKKLVRLVEEQVAKRAAAADAAANAQLTTAATTVANADKAKPAEPKKIDVGTVAALGVAFGAIGTALATVAGYAVGLLHLPFWQVCLALAGLLLLVSGPAMLIAWLKLRQRNLGPILDANGWAINGRVRMNVPFGGSLTAVAELPPGATTALDDPFAEAPNAWPKLVAVAVALCFLASLLNSQGLIHRWTDGKYGDEKARGNAGTNSAPALLNAGTNAPAAK